ncbi:MAG: hypothetical protein LC135_04575 [Phycisphaerae bacterium]|nr:hypothetical protein [Phycisphaerae bacterium]MCZ2399129.1 hypothetical protein [Phycisphaerae bacterium]NUQ48855.1 hypothetical protein [Phycisphaerae bacterium]
MRTWTPNRLMTRLSALAAIAPALPGCSSQFLANQTEDRTGNIEVVFINNTPYRAVLSMGSFDSLDRNPPGPVQFQQLRIEGFTTTAVGNFPCRRVFAIATPELLRRVLDTDTDQSAGFDIDAFNDVVHFSAAPADSELATAPTAGTAAPREVRLGVDFSCADRLFFTLQEDPSAPGGFRIDYTVILDTLPGGQ